MGDLHGKNLISPCLKVIDLPVIVFAYYKVLNLPRLMDVENKVNVLFET